MNRVHEKGSNMEAESRLAAFLREQAQNQNISQNELARKLGVSPATLSVIRHGHTPTLDIIRQMADRLGMAVNDLAELAGVITLEGEGQTELAPEVRAVMRRYANLPAQEQKVLLRVLEQLISFAEAREAGTGAGGMLPAA